MNENNNTQAITVKTKDWEALTQAIDDVIDIAKSTGTPDYALTHGYNMVKTVRLTGVALAKLLYELDEAWHEFDTEEPIADAVEKAGICDKDTFLKYSRMFRYVLVDHPELAGKPVYGLIKLTAAAREGQLTKQDWKDVKNAHDSRAIVSVRDRVRGTHTSGHSRLSIWRTRDGQLFCKKGNQGEIKACGYLPPDTGDEDVDTAVARMMSVGVFDQ
jgi:hypothetical protein